MGRGEGPDTFPGGAIARGAPGAIRDWKGGSYVDGPVPKPRGRGDGANPGGADCCGVLIEDGNAPKTPGGI